MPKTPARIAVCSCIVMALAQWGKALADDSLFDPFTGFRMAQYRAPIPASPDGIESVTTGDLLELTDKSAVLVDVHPLRSFHIAEDGTWIHAMHHQTLPDAIWLPVVGWGVIEPWAEAYLGTALAHRVQRDAPVVVFCQLDCWLSWNAVQRVRDLGYKALWYPGGIDDWQAAGHSLVPVEPLPLRE
ncbi:rhodanese-like domain-containing protein [Primorskyibacter flagellatus]|jgi:PQQ-dependent catabolism-associated CXXCW motif protein|uniref:rhodanese-like domain-containing protein n=1 Tax=Primorskyibacter flagellatus TaxID=1387277 RepID=UPI003A8D95BB